MSYSTAIPCLRYADAQEAFRFLREVLGFQEHLVVPGDGGQIVHAQLTLGSGMIMVSSAGGPSELAAHFAQPEEVGRRETQLSYLVVPDADAVHARASAAGWGILRALRDEEYGGRGFTCQDPEGHIWAVGTYDPWA